MLSYDLRCSILLHKTQKLASSSEARLLLCGLAAFRRDAGCLLKESCELMVTTRGGQLNAGEAGRLLHLRWVCACLKKRSGSLGVPSGSRPVKRCALSIRISGIWVGRPARQGGLQSAQLIESCVGGNRTRGEVGQASYRAELPILDRPLTDRQIIDRVLSRGLSSPRRLHANGWEGWPSPGHARRMWSQLQDACAKMKRLPDARPVGACCAKFAVLLLISQGKLTDASKASKYVTKAC